MCHTSSELVVVGNLVSTLTSLRSDIQFSSQQAIPGQVPRTKNLVPLATDSYQIEGNLIASDMAAELQTGDLKGQAPEDFGLAKTTKLADEIAVAWGDAKAYWVAFQRALSRLDESSSATSITREQWIVPLLRSLGYDPAYTPKAEVVEGQTFAISHRTDSGANRPPVHTIGCRVKLEERPPSGTPRISAHALLQEYLNRTEHLWGIVTNGLRWRLLRDSSLMSRLTYVEFDLEQILNGENFAEFGLFYRLFHRSRLPQGMDDADTCLLETYHQASLEQGGRVRDRLRDGVEKALIQLGTGFLQHPSNQALRQKFESGALMDTPYYRQLLQLIYRLLFLMVGESRNLLLTENDPEKARIYQEYYSIQRLRNLAERPGWRREGFQDVWQGLRVTFRLFDENWRGQLLGLSPLNGDLFGSGTLKDLDECAIDNHDLLLAIRQLSLYEQKGQLRRVNYGALDVEELGSIYTSLLDFYPQVVQRQGIYSFQLVVGSERKTTGAYYTPAGLVNLLIKNALDPVIKDRLQSAETKEQKELALLSLKVIDPACGSGHVLLAAARRIGKELACLRTGEPQPGPEPLRRAVREVIQNCVYGVDINPLAVDLCKVGLWIEGFNPGLTLNFLDHRIKCGNSLVGVLDLNCLNEGIPDEAFKAVTGDSKSLSSTVRKSNKSQRKDLETGQLSLDFEGLLEVERSYYALSWRDLGSFADNKPQDNRQKKAKYKEICRDPAWWRDYSACNLWTAAFFTPLTEQNLQLLPTTAALAQLLQGNTATQRIVDAANQLAAEKHFFHWPLEFPEVFDQGSFDCVLGNTPWERIKLQEKEFFLARSPEIANATNKAAREKLIKQLPKVMPGLAQEFKAAKYHAEAQSKFIRESGEFPLAGVGDVNTYAVFAERARELISSGGRIGIVLPIGIATDDTTKRYFGDLIKTQSLVSLIGFENESFIFQSVHHSFKFCVITVTGQGIKNKEADFIFFCRYLKNVDIPQRHFKLNSQEISLINPNTLTCPVFRTIDDTKLVGKIYRRFPVLINESSQENTWGIHYLRLVHLSDHSAYLKDYQQLLQQGAKLVKNRFFLQDDQRFLPVYEAKQIWLFNHRYATYEGMDGKQVFEGKAIELTDEELIDLNAFALPRYWVSQNFFNSLLSKFSYARPWLLGFRDVTSNVVERTCIPCIIPLTPATVSFPTIGIDRWKQTPCLLANLSSLVFDFVTRTKVGGNHLSFGVFKQLPVIPPETYTSEDIEFISSRVLELVYTAWDMQPFAQDMGYDSEPFIWNSERRALLRAELDAYYARLYGLTRDELRYILDPADVYGPDFPSETFRVLKNNEIKKFGEYRTQRLVLQAWDRMFGS